MSAASASAAIGAAQQAGPTLPSVGPSTTRTSVRKQSISTRKPSADGTSLDVPLLSPRRISRRGRDVGMSSLNGEVGADVALLSHPKDFSHSLHTGEHQVPAQQAQIKHKTLAVPTAKGSPFKHKTLHKDVHIVARRKPSSVLDLTGHFFSRFFLVFVIGTGLGSSLWNWRTRPQISHSTRIISTEVEKLEEFVARTTKWMQLQLQVVDLKIGQEVGDLRKELQKELHSQQLHVATEVNGLKDKVEMVGATLDAFFSQGGPLSKREALELIKDVVDRKAAEGQGQALSLDNVRTSARQVLVRELERHSADGIGRVDYALGSGGGRVIDHSEGYFYGRGADWWNDVVSFLPGFNRRHALADKILQPSFGEPGQCLPLKGSTVWVDISLRTTIRPDAITLEHVSKENAYDVSSAPKEFRVFGWREARGQADRLQNPKPVTLGSLGEFKYDIEKPNVQTFPLADGDFAGVLINVIRLHILSNYGNPSHTCIYRVRVHGSDQASISLAPSIGE